VRVFSLQKGDGAKQAGKASTELRLIDHTAEIDDFADTAALVSALDLVVSVDTSVAHLAGAMGKPVWLLSRRDGCWRWLLDRDDSPWYPSMRIFRQESRGDWKPVVARVASELAKEAAKPRPHPTTGQVS
jgi:ADP-heptose:LPS heptosyltransferase